MPWMTLVFKFAPLVIGAVQAVEKIVRGPKGQEKQDAAVQIIQSVITQAEDVAGKDLLNDAAVMAAVRTAIDAIVAVENAVAAAKAMAHRGA